MQTTSNLLIRYFKGLCTETETSAVLAFIAADTDPRLVQACMEEAYSLQGSDELMDLSDEEYATAWQLFRQRASRLGMADTVSEMADTIRGMADTIPESADTVPKRIDDVPVRTRIYRLKWARYAAAILVLATVLGITYNALQKSHQKDVMPAGTAGQLVLGAPGTHKQVRLTDGSLVYLFPGSQLAIAAGYNRSDRRVTLKGRAYFDIRQNPQKPFIVQTQPLEVRVLGTSFEVNEATQDQLQVTVRTGLVGINKGDNELTRLSPDQQIRYQVDDGDFAVTHVDAENSCAWINGELVFDNMPLPQVCRTLEAWYGVTIQLPGAQWKQKRVSVKFSRQSLANVLKVLSATTGFTYQTDHKLIKIN